LAEHGRICVLHAHTEFTQDEKGENDSQVGLREVQLELVGLHDARQQVDLNAGLLDQEEGQCGQYHVCCYLLERQIELFTRDHS